MQRRALSLLAALLPGTAVAEAPVTIFAASVFQDGLRALARDWVALGHPAPRLSFAASSALARQIEQGAPADIFLSADEGWMDFLQSRDLILPESRVNALGNGLVLVAPADTARPVTLQPGTDLVALLGPRGRLALGDPAHVPAGRFAQAALEWMGQWQALLPRLARTENVRAALLLVQRGEAPLGIVYATDAWNSAGVQVAGRFPAESHPRILHSFARTRRGPGQALLNFLTGAQAMPVWQRHGFTLPR